MMSEGGFLAFLFCLWLVIGYLAVSVLLDLFVRA
jgi:hypothetical protein